MVAGATSTICTNPLWVIKTRFMVRLVVLHRSYALLLIPDIQSRLDAIT
jgi:hypothetical protein